MNHTDLRELRDRMSRAANELAILAEQAGNSMNCLSAARLNAKRSGVLLAASYVEDAIALAATPLDEVEVSPARHSDPATSKAAALTLSPTSAYGKLVREFYRYDLRVQAHPYLASVPGLTARQAVEAAGIGGASPWKRVSEIQKAGIIAPTGGTSTVGSGRAQQILAITEFGKREVERLGLDAS